MIFEKKLSPYKKYLVKVIKNEKIHLQTKLMTNLNLLKKESSIISISNFHDAIKPRSNRPTSNKILLITDANLW